MRIIAVLVMDEDIPTMDIPRRIDRAISLIDTHPQTMAHITVTVEITGITATTIGMVTVVRECTSKGETLVLGFDIESMTLIERCAE